MLFKNLLVSYKVMFILIILLLIKASLVYKFLRYCVEQIPQFNKLPPWARTGIAVCIFLFTVCMQREYKDLRQKISIGTTKTFVTCQQEKGEVKKVVEKTKEEVRRRSVQMYTRFSCKHEKELYKFFEVLHCTVH